MSRKSRLDFQRRRFVSRRGPQGSLCSLLRRAAQLTILLLIKKGKLGFSCLLYHPIKSGFQAKEAKKKKKT